MAGNIPPASLAGKWNQLMPEYSYIKNTTDGSRKTLKYTSGSGNIINNVTPTDDTISFNKGFTTAIAPSVGDLISLISIENSLGVPLPDSPVTHYFYIKEISQSGITVTAKLDREIGFNIKNNDPDWTDNNYDKVQAYHIAGEGAKDEPFTILNPIETLLTSSFSDVIEGRLIKGDNLSDFNIKLQDGFKVGFKCTLMNVGAGGINITTTGSDTIGGTTLVSSTVIVTIQKITDNSWLAY